MPVFISDPRLEEKVRAEREASGLDRHDEVWEGVYFMPPIANNEHQAMGSRLGGIFQQVVLWPDEGTIYVGVNVSDREDDWQYNYRVPDIAVALTGGLAKDCGTHLCGGPDLVVEVISPRDRSREKLDFYSAIGARELLLVDRNPWLMELYQKQDDELVHVGQSSLDQPASLASNVLPLSFRLIPGTQRPLIEVTHRDGVQHWLA